MRQLPDSYTVRYIKLPASVGGTISESPDGHINIYINDQLDSSAQQKAFIHELDHWEHNDLNNDEDIRTVESRGPQRHLPPLVLARDLPPVKRKKQGLQGRQESTAALDDWKDDIYLRLPYYE